jgi:purine-binding chemotaxis protein CheW
MLEAVEFVLAAERYAVESRRVREVYPLRELTALPCTPPFVLGIINVRGQVLTVPDLRPFFELPAAQPLAASSQVIILETSDTGVGIHADAVVGVRLIPLDDLQTGLPTLTGPRADFLRGLAGDRLVVLDAARLLSDPRLVVHEEVGG